MLLQNTDNFFFGNCLKSGDRKKPHRVTHFIKIEKNLLKSARFSISIQHKSVDETLKLSKQTQRILKEHFFKKSFLRYKIIEKISIYNAI